MNDRRVAGAMAGGLIAGVALSAVMHGGRLALSASAGLAYAAVVDPDAGSPTGGAAFGVCTAHFARQLRA